MKSQWCALSCSTKHTHNYLYTKYHISSGSRKSDGDKTRIARGRVKGARCSTYSIRERERARGGAWNGVTSARWLNYWRTRGIRASERAYSTVCCVVIPLTGEAKARVYRRVASPWQILAGPRTDIDPISAARWLPLLPRADKWTLCTRCGYTCYTCYGIYTYRA